VLFDHTITQFGTGRKKELSGIVSHCCNPKPQKRISGLKWPLIPIILRQWNVGVEQIILFGSSNAFFLTTPNAVPRTH